MMINKKSLCFLFSSILMTHAVAEPHYAIIVDAGSSGSRLHIFKYDTQTTLPTISDVFSEKISTALSTFASHPRDAGASLKPALDDAIQYFATNNIPAHNISTKVLGTAGMRLLDRKSQREIYHNVKTYITMHYSPQLNAVETHTITGEEEGIYDWLDINYLSNTFADHSKTYGSLDVGGASTQIAFETTNFTNVKNVTRFTINGQHYLVFSKSFLGLGQDQARYSMDTYQDAGTCYPAGYTLDVPAPINFNFPTCTNNYSQLINTFNVQNEIPPINPQQEFIGFSGAYYAFNFFGVDQTPYQSILEAQITSVCAETWDQMKANYPTTSDDYLSAECANGTYIDNLFFSYYHLHDGQLKVVSKINSTSVDWTLGAMLYDLIATHR